MRTPVYVRIPMSDMIRDLLLEELSLHEREQESLLEFTMTCPAEFLLFQAIVLQYDELCRKICDVKLRLQALPECQLPEE